ncbi:MAG: glycosyltransferase family 2 protein [Butyrivibrio sp.]|nr:glycosyltransferase family 2 protein [Butyrivibrio sp.]
MKKVTVVIPNFNGKEYLDDCLSSLGKQTFRDFDTILVDDGSTDGSASYVKEKWPEVTVIENSGNKGFAAAVNAGIRACESPYVFLLNNDTVCSEEAISSLVKVMDKKQKAFSVQAKMLALKPPHNIDDCGDYYCALGWAFTPGKDADPSRFSKREALTSACAGAAMYRRDLFEKVGLFDEAHFCYLEDVDIGYRARLKGYVNLYEPSSVVYHAGSATSGSRYNEFKVRLTAANNLYLIYKNMPALQVIINLPLILIGIAVKHVFYTRGHLGTAHVKGLGDGFNKIFKNTDKKVKFDASAILFSIKLQLELWVNCFRRLLHV